MKTLPCRLTRVNRVRLCNQRRSWAIWLIAAVSCVLSFSSLLIFVAPLSTIFYLIVHLSHVYIVIQKLMLSEGN